MYFSASNLFYVILFLKYVKGLPNGVSHENEKKGNKQPPTDFSFLSWFSDSEQKDDIQDEVAELIKDDLWPNPLTYFNNENEEEDMEEEGDYEEKDEDDSEDDDQEDNDEDNDEEEA